MPRRTAAVFGFRWCISVGHSNRHLTHRHGGREEDEARVTRPGGVSSRTGLHGHVSLLWPPEARSRHDQAHPPCRRLWRHLPRHLRRLRSPHQRNSPRQGFEWRGERQG